MMSSPPSNQNPHCKICDGRARYLYTTPNAYGGPAELKHYRCTRCGLVFVGSHVTLKQVGRAYEEMEAGGGEHQTPRESELKFRAALEALRVSVGSAGHALDIGAGRGEFAQLLLEAGCGSVAVHEIPSRDLVHLRAKGVRVFQDFDYRSIPDDSFDFVSLLDVAEHALYPLDLLRACHRVLKAGGSLYIQVPAVTRVDRVMHLTRGLPIAAKMGRTWQAGRTSIFHLQIFTRKALKIALRRAGFVRFTIEQRNQLPFSMDHYVRLYLCDRVAPYVTPIVRPLLSTAFFNANRGFVRAKKTHSQ
jgi:SAM-dependent methyltransferase